MHVFVNANGPVHEVEVEVVELEVGESLAKSFADIIGMVHVIPQLGRDEELVARDDAAGNDVGEGVAYFFFVVV